MKHPFIGIFDEDVKLYKAIGQVCECCQRPFEGQITPATSYERKTLRQAEYTLINSILSEIPATVTYHRKQLQSLFCGENGAPVSILICRHANLIQARLRGVTGYFSVIVNPWTFEKYRDVFVEHSWYPTNTELNGWLQVGVINSSIRVFTGAVPTDVAIVFKHGDEEHLSIAGYSGKYGYALNGSGHTWQDWCSVIRFEEDSSLKHA